MSGAGEVDGLGLAKALLVSERLRAAEGRASSTATVAPEQHPLAASAWIARVAPERSAPAIEALATALPTLLAGSGVEPDLADRLVDVLRRPWFGARGMLLRSAWHSLTSAVMAAGVEEYEAKIDEIDRAAAAVMLDAAM